MPPRLLGLLTLTGAFARLLSRTVTPPGIAGGGLRAEGEVRNATTVNARPHEKWPRRVLPEPWDMKPPSGRREASKPAAMVAVMAHRDAIAFTAHTP